MLPDRSPAPGNPWPKVDPSFNPPKNAPDTVSRLPSGRRPSNSNWAGHTYDFRNTPETQPELLEKFPDGVYFGKEGFPDFGPYTIKTVRLDGEFTGRRADYALADAKAGFGPSNPRPKGYVWHHHQDRHTMQLVREPVHDGARHAGGIALRQGPKGSDRIR
ncbi:HNH endonuclease [Tsukamurella ocularis]|uniref:HNH endonuclease n=1 Tax=Tsukamurella ocularis TaxID=1970234 RepID=UPI0035B61C58